MAWWHSDLKWSPRRLTRHKPVVRSLIDQFGLATPDCECVGWFVDIWKHPGDAYGVWYKTDYLVGASGIWHAYFEIRGIVGLRIDVNVIVRINLKKTGSSIKTSDTDVPHTCFRLDVNINLLLTLQTEKKN